MPPVGPEIDSPMLSLLAQSDTTMLMPPQASTYAGDVDWLFYFTLWVSVFFFVLIGALMIAFAIMYRQKDKNFVAGGATHSTALEVTWTAIPIVLVLAIFYWGFKGYLDMNQPSSNSIEVIVTAYQWGWQFSYPNGATDNQLHLPADRPVKLVLESRDVIHSLFVPAFRMKKDVVPGRYNKTWVQSPWVGRRADEVFTISDTGEKTDAGYKRIAYPLFCTEYCGTGHSQMAYPKYHAFVYKYDDWKAKIDDLNALDPPVETGKKVYSQYCAQCHSIDGSQIIGPTWKDVYGEKGVPMADGTKIDVDDNYIRESILDPQAHYVAGFEGIQMPSFKGQLSDEQIRGVIEYMKTISSHYDGPVMESWDEEGDQGGGGNSGSGEAGGDDTSAQPRDASPSQGDNAQPEQGQEQSQEQEQTPPKALDDAPSRDPLAAAEG